MNEQEARAKLAGMGLNQDTIDIMITMAQDHNVATWPVGGVSVEHNPRDRTFKVLTFAPYRT